MHPDKLKKLAINTMIGSLIGASAIAVIAVLVGEFNDVLGRALFTLLIVTLHALVCLGFLDSKSKSSSPNDLRIFTDIIFVIIVLSFITSIFAIWDLFPGELTARLYGTYFIVAFASLHAEMLNKTTGLDATINKLVYGNYVLMSLVAALLIPIVWLASGNDFPDFYYRLLSATAIVDATLTILTVILHRLYLQKHPELNSQLFAAQTLILDANGNSVPAPQNASIRKRGIHPLLVVLIILLLLQFIGPIIFLIVG